MASKLQQSLSDRLKRLSDSRCPIHGMKMKQVGAADIHGLHTTICPRVRCGIGGTTTVVNGAISLSPQHWHLLN